jgi:hypothetical protein
VFEGGTEGKYKRQSVPEGHKSSEYGRQRSGDFGVGVVGQFSQLRMDECRHSELIACERCCHSCGRYVIGHRHGENRRLRNYWYGIVK